MTNAGTQNAAMSSRPRTAQPLLLPQPFGSTSRFIVKEPSPRPSFNEILYTGFHGVSSKDDKVSPRAKEENRLKRTFEGVVTNVEKMARRFITNRPAQEDPWIPDHWTRKGLRSRRSPSLRQGRRPWEKAARVEKAHTSAGSCSCVQTKIGLNIGRASRMELDSTLNASWSGTSLPSVLSSPRHLLLPQDFPAQAGAGARAAVAAATLRTRPSATHISGMSSITENACQLRHQNDSPIEGMDSFSSYERQRDDSVHDLDDRMEVDVDKTIGVEILQTIPDPLTRFPIEVVEIILTHLDTKTVDAIRLVSKNWKLVAESNAVWRSLFLREYTPPAAHNSSYLKIGGLGLGRTLRAPQDYRAMAIARQRLEENWQRAKPSAIYFCGHTDSVYCCQFDEDKIITGSRDRTIRVWDVNTLECLKVIGSPENQPLAPPPRLEEHPHTVHTVESVNGTIEGESIFYSPQFFHQASILCLQYDHEIMVTGSSDTTCIVWDIKTYEPLAHLTRHTAGVLDICFDDKYIVSCSKDFTICVWSRKTFELVKVLEGHSGPVNAVQMRGDLLVSASGDGNAKLWDLTTMQYVRTFPSKDRGLAAVEFSDDGQYVLAGGNDQVIYKYNANTAELIHVYVGHSNLVRSLFLDCNNRRVLSGSYDQGMRVYDFDTGSEIGIYNNWTTSWILAAKSDYRRIVATSQDGRVLMMDFGWDVPNIDMLKNQ